MVAPLETFSAARPAPPMTLRTAEELAQCSQALRADAASLQDAPIVLVAYITDVSRNWLLGLSAAAFSIPIVLAGQGMRWVGARGKIWGVARTAQLLGEVAPRATVVVLDGADTFVANSVSNTLAAAAQAIGSSHNTLLLSTECNLWPSCERKVNFSRLATHRACQQSWHSCFPNSGGIMGSGRAISRLTEVLLPHFQPTNDTKRHWRFTNDQYQVHSVYIEQEQHDLQVDVDGSGTFVVSLMECRHMPKRRALNCYDAPWNAQRHLAVNASTREATLSWVSTHGQARVQRPLILHSNADPSFAVMNSATVKPAWEWLLPIRDGMLQSRLIALDSAHFGPCNVTTLGAALALGHNQTGRAWATSAFGKG